MALSPLQIEILDDAGAPVDGATIEIRHELTATTATVYNRDGTVLSGPHLTDASGSKLVWLVNGIYEWRATGTWTTDWKPFRAWAGFGVEGLFTSNPTDVSLADPVPSSATTLDTITVPSFNVEDAVGGVRVTVDFAFDHMRDLMLSLRTPSGTGVTLWDGQQLPAMADDYAFDGQVTFAAAGTDPYTDPDTGLAVPMVDGGTYAALLGSIRGVAAAGAWSPQWQNAALEYTPHTGSFRSWSLEMLPV